MRILIASAEPEEAHVAGQLGAAGVFADPVALAKAGPEWRRKLATVMSRIHGPVHIQATERTTERILAQFEQFQRLLDERMVATICISAAGVAAARTLQESLIPTNITAVVTFNQAALAAQSGADYVSVCFGRIDVTDGTSEAATGSLIESLAVYIERNSLDARIVATDVRNPEQFRQAAQAGAHLVAAPAGLLATVITNEQTDRLIDEYEAAWKSIRAIK